MPQSSHQARDILSRILGDHDMVARLKGLEHRHRRGLARAERGRPRPSLERGEAALEGVAVRVRVARVDEPVRERPVGRALERRREVNRRGHRAGRCVGGVTGMDGERLELHRMWVAVGTREQRRGAGALDAES